MIIKKLLGEILVDMGFVNQKQLDKALQKQKKASEPKPLPERLRRAELVSEARLIPRKTPLLGQVLTELGFATKKQINKALKEQDKTLDLYKTLENKKLGAAIEIGSMVNSTLNLAEVLALIMKYVNQVTNSNSSTLMLLDEKTGELVFSVPTGPKAGELIDIRIPPGEGIAGWVAKNQQPVLAANAEEDPRFYPKIDKISGLKTKSILCVPLKAKTRLIGVLEAVNKSDGSVFTKDDALFLSIFAHQAAVAIENARLYGELKDQMAEARQMQTKLANSEKFQALGQMASGVAHDFNNILSGIMGYAEMALYDISENSRARKSIEQVLKASNRAEGLVKQILAFSRQSESDQERRPIQVHHIVQEALKLTRASLPTTIDIHQDISTHGTTVLADPTQIHQILMNLCTNAHHAMREKGGKLEISLAPVELDSTEVGDYPDLKPGSYLKLSISDTGDGMDARTMQRIFDPYFTTKEKGVGIGMGLSVVHGIIKRHNGAIKVFSKPGEGSSFQVLLPRIEKEIEYRAETLEPLPLGKERILFVDDEKALIDLGKKMLERLGYKVVSKTSSVEALEAFRADPHKFDLVITDMTMPNMTGDELAEKIMAIRPDTPIILCTGFSHRITEEQAKKMGIREFVMKPLVMSDLAKTIRKVLDKK